MTVQEVMLKALSGERHAFSAMGLAEPAGFASRLG